MGEEMEEGMNFITGELVPTLSQPRREYRYLGGIYPDGRDGTLWLEIWHAQRRHGTKSFLSRYSVGEVQLPGWAGRAFILDKEVGDEEHGPAKPGDRKPPYCVRTREFVGPDGEVYTQATCQCTATACKVGLCRHTDAVIELLEQGAFDEEPNRYHETNGAEAYQRTEQKADRLAGVSETHADRNGEEAGRATTHLPELRRWPDDPGAGANPHFANQTSTLLSNADYSF